MDMAAEYDDAPSYSDATRASYHDNDAGNNEQTRHKKRLTPVLIKRADMLATIPANDLALRTWLACALWLLALGMYAGQSIVALLDHALRALPPAGWFAGV
jgi:hypothetical protein